VVAMATVTGGCTSSEPPALSAACRMLIDHRHPGLVDAMERVPGTGGDVTVWIARDREATAVVECAPMATPERRSFQLQVDDGHMTAGGQEMQARAGDVVQVAWFDALPDSERVTVVRNGHRLDPVRRPAARSDGDTCPTLVGTTIRAVGCGWIDVLEWTLPPTARVDVSAPIDAVVTDAVGRDLPFWRFDVTSAPRGLTVRFGVTPLRAGRYQVQIPGEAELTSSFEVR